MSGHRSVQPPSQRSRAAGPARQVAYDVLRAVSQDDAYANLVLPVLLRRRALAPRDAALATELAYGTLRLRGTYDAILAGCSARPLAEVDAPLLDALRLGAHQLLSTRVPAHAAVDQSVALVRDRVGPGAAGFANAVLRRVAAADLTTWLERVAPAADVDLVGHLTVTRSHPAWVVRALAESLGAHGRSIDELDDLLAADNEPAAVALAARPHQAEVGELLAAGARAGRWSPVGAVLPGGDPTGVPAVAQGRAQVQDEGSQLAALMLAAAPLQGRDERWLDLCAGPGGKAALLAAVAAGRGARLEAVEVAAHRVELVAQALAGTPGDPQVRQGDGRDVGREHPGTADRVLVDAPCTGLGALRRRPEARWRRQPSDLVALTPLQRELLDSALAAVRPGGVVAYVTCSPHPAETLAVVADALRAHPDVEPLDAAAVLTQVTGRPVPDTGPGPAVQLWPHRHGTDAMFVALLRRLD